MLRSHPPDHELVLALDRELSRRRQATVDEHVSACVACRARLHEIRVALDEATGLYEGAFAAPSDSSSRLRLERALQDAADEWNQSWRARLRGAMAASATRAGVGMAAVVGLLVAVWISRTGDGFRASRPESGTPLPIAALTPGAVSSLTAGELCSGLRPSRLVTAASREQVLRRYGMERVSTRTYELDALITPELGGTTAPENLWPQPYASPVWNARVKDELEQLLPKLVCSNQVDLARAQREMATDWVAAYKRYFRTDVPLNAYAGVPRADEDELEFAPVRYAAENAPPMVLEVNAPTYVMAVHGSSGRRPGE